MKNKGKTIILLLFLVVGIGTMIYYGYNFFLKKAYPIEYDEYVSKYSEKYNVEKALVFAVIKSESNFREEAQSKAGAIGLMQIMPETFEWLKKHHKLWDIENNNLIDPEINIKCGVYLISLLQKRYESDEVAISAYNAGLGNVDKWLMNKNYSIDGKTLIKIPYKDTAAYVKNVLKSREIYRKLYFNK